MKKKKSDDKEVKLPESPHIAGEENKVNIHQLLFDLSYLLFWREEE